MTMSPLSLIDSNTSTAKAKNLNREALRLKKYFGDSTPPINYDEISWNAWNAGV